MAKPQVSLIDQALEYFVEFDEHYGPSLGEDRCAGRTCQHALASLRQMTMRSNQQ